MKSENWISAHGPQAVERHADRRADDAVLGERRVDHALGAELVEQALGRAEHAAGLADVLAQHQHVRVAAHAFPEPVVHRLDECALRHGSPYELRIFSSSALVERPGTSSTVSTRPP